MAARLTILLTLVATAAMAAATLEGPTSAGVGSTVDVKVAGSTNERDFVTIVPKGSRQGTDGGYQYVAALKLKAPVKPGEYEIRLLSADAPYPTLDCVADSRRDAVCDAGVRTGGGFLPD
jgi:hypothetical protein